MVDFQPICVIILLQYCDPTDYKQIQILGEIYPDLAIRQWLEQNYIPPPSETKPESDPTDDDQELGYFRRFLKTFWPEEEQPREGRSRRRSRSPKRRCPRRSKSRKRRSPRRSKSRKRRSPRRRN